MKFTPITSTDTTLEIPDELIEVIRAYTGMLAFVKRVARADCIRDEPCSVRAWTDNVSPENMALRITEMASQARSVLVTLPGNETTTTH